MDGDYRRMMGWVLVALVATVGFAFVVVELTIRLFDK
jgi:hypothetical protein